MGDRRANEFRKSVECVDLDRRPCAVNLAITDTDRLPTNSRPRTPEPRETTGRRRNSRRLRTGSSASCCADELHFSLARDKLGTETGPSALADCQRLRVSIIGAVPGAFHIWRMKRAKFGVSLFAYKWALRTPIDRPINSSTFGIEWSNSSAAQNFGCARGNGPQNSIASVQLTLCFVCRSAIWRSRSAASNPSE